MKNLGLAITALCAAGIFCVAIRQNDPSLVHAQDQSGLVQKLDQSSSAPIFPEVFLRDVVVSNTDPDLKNTDTFFNSEPGIAIDPTDPRKVVISAFSGAWSPLGNGRFGNAPLWYTRDGGRLWTKEFTISPPPGTPASVLAESPCDETFDYGRDGVLYGTFLLNGSGEEGASCSDSDADGSDTGIFQAVVTGATGDPAGDHAWRWLVINGKTQPTNTATPDQPWIITNKSPVRPDRENVYVAYQATPEMRVAVARAQAPPNFHTDNLAGTSELAGLNPGHRIAADRRSGDIYSLYQTGGSIQCSAGAAAVRYMLNRSRDGGRTWGLNGNPNGMEAAQACSHQNLLTYSFGEPVPGELAGGVNPLRGGVDALAVDSHTGNVYVVYGKFDEAAGRDRIAIVRLTHRANEELEPGPFYFVSGPEHQSALPAVAVTENGVVGVLYDTADGLDPVSSRPFFAAHLAISEDYGANFHTVLLQKFVLPENSPGGQFGPRPLGDYQQLKSLNKTLFGVFAGDGQPFGRPFHKIDPIFVKVSVR